MRGAIVWRAIPSGWNATAENAKAFLRNFKERMLEFQHDQ
jgi:hypothetical protein